jgi:hypothetical protein
MLKHSHFNEGAELGLLVLNLYKETNTQVTEQSLGICMQFALFTFFRTTRQNYFSFPRFIGSYYCHGILFKSCDKVRSWIQIMNFLKVVSDQWRRRISSFAFVSGKLLHKEKRFWKSSISLSQRKYSRKICRLAHRMGARVSRTRFLLIFQRANASERDLFIARAVLQYL